jgi:putative transposase
MPWRECDPMHERIQFVLLLQQGEHSMTELCDLFEISRKTGYKWLLRYRQYGPAGLNDFSRAPHTIPHKAPDDVVQFVRDTMNKHPYWGGRKVRDYAYKIAPDLEMPSETTVSSIIFREGLKKNKQKRKRPGHPGKPIFPTEEIHDLWTTDFKGEFKTLNGEYCYPLTIMDEHTRFIIEIKGFPAINQEKVMNVFKDAFKKHGKPKAIKSDNGAPFASIGIARLSKLSAWWIKLGILPVLTQPASPGQNSYHERMHKTLKEETAIPPARDLAAQNRKFRMWMEEYNFDRPHESLNGDFPCEYYEPSPRKFDPAISRIKYPQHFEVRRVSRNNCMRWKNNYISIGSVLNDEYLGLEPIADGIWAVWFSWKRIGFFDESKMKIVDTYGKTGRKKNV